MPRTGAASRPAPTRPPAPRRGQAQTRSVSDDGRGIFTSTSKSGQLAENARGTPAQQRRGPAPDHIVKHHMRPHAPRPGPITPRDLPFCAILARRHRHLPARSADAGNLWSYVDTPYLDGLSGNGPALLTAIFVHPDTVVAPQPLLPARLIGTLACSRSSDRMLLEQVREAQVEG